MLLEFDVQRLENALEDFYTVTGVGISILYEDYSPLGSKKSNNLYCRLVQSSKPGLVRCLESNRVLLDECKEKKKPMMRICHAGLVEIAVPILYNDNIVGYVMLGHIRAEGYNMNFEQGLSGLPVDPNLAQDIYSSLPTHERKRLISIMNIAEMFGKFIIMENFLTPKESENLEQIRRYVYDNIDKKLTAQKIANGVHVSKSTLYSTVSSSFGCTVSEFISKVKIDKAKELLQKTDLQVEEIAERLGFSSPAYFGKVFKRIVGVSPLRYRKKSPINI
ncbi:MAG: PocR ligand-binding domain-containing protein [Clostridia bacterium]|nr:PocR ligand-binding domain-containing protein [Clostridia bacterium]